MEFTWYIIKQHQNKIIYNHVHIAWEILYIQLQITSNPWIVIKTLWNIMTQHYV